MPPLAGQPADLPAAPDDGSLVGRP
jgi:hypothetical protein